MVARIGFTGTQVGMTKAQQEEVERLLYQYRQHDSEFHHGDCIGADAQAHEIARRLGYCIVIHPSVNSTKRSFCVGDEERARMDYVSRNHQIVDETTFLIAAPQTELERLRRDRLRSGTWATIRYAVKHNHRVILVLPDGTTTHLISAP